MHYVLDASRLQKRHYECCSESKSLWEFLRDILEVDADVNINIMDMGVERLLCALHRVRAQRN